MYITYIVGPTLLIQLAMTYIRDNKGHNNRTALWHYIMQMCKAEIALENIANGQKWPLLSTLGCKL